LFYPNILSLVDEFSLDILQHNTTEFINQIFQDRRYQKGFWKSKDQLVKKLLWD